MLRRFKGMLIVSTLVALSLTPTAAVSAASTLTIDTGSYVCSHGVCDLGSGSVGAFFGKVERFDQDGFYGPCDPGIGNALPGGRGNSVPAASKTTARSLRFMRVSSQYSGDPRRG